MTINKLWRLSEAGPDNLGLTCTDNGLILGRTPLIEKRGSRFAVRDRNEIERLLGRTYGNGLDVNRLMPGLATVASAMNANDPCLARIAAVHLRIPDLPSVTARDDVEAEDNLIKYGDWNPALHPRTGTPPNPGWFAPTDGSANQSTPARVAENDSAPQRSDAISAADDNRVKLPPGDYIDELADFVEWIANAKPKDEKAIRAEIKRYYFDVGDTFGGEALHRALSDILEPGLPKKARQEILNSIAIYAMADPAEMGQLRALIVGGALSSGAAGASLFLQEEEAAVTGADATATTSADIAAAGLPSKAWKWGWARRGRYFEEKLGRTLHPNFPVIDRFVNGIATSIKSIDLNAATYQDAVRLAGRLNKYIDDVAAFNGAKWAGDEVKLSAIKGRALSLAVPKGNMTGLQRDAIAAARTRGAALGVDLIVTAF